MMFGIGCSPTKANITVSLTLFLLGYTFHAQSDALPRTIYVLDPNLDIIADGNHVLYFLDVPLA